MRHDRSRGPQTWHTVPARPRRHAHPGRPLGSGAASAAAQGGHNPGRPLPNIVLVHGAWADGSSWSGVTSRLQADGYTVYVLPNPLRGITSDAAYVASFLGTITGPIILVGHSYGGAVITNAATGNANVKALVYIDAFAPDEGESLLQLAGAPPPPGQAGSCLGGDPTTVFNFVPYPDAPQGDVDLYIKPDLFPSCFANDLPARQAAVLAASQRPIALSALGEPSGTPAWKTIPSWYLIGTIDKVIPPYAQRFMAERAHAQIVEVKASHPSMISHPGAAANLIEKAAARGIRGALSHPANGAHPMNKTIVFVHGAWLTSLSWENFAGYFEAKGYTTSAPEWPLRDRSVAELRASTPSDLAQIGVRELVDHFDSIIRPLPEPPILIGHSFGGLIVQQLLDRGLGSAGVALDAVAPEGVLAVDWTVLKANSSVLFRWMNWEKVLTMTFPEFQFAFTNNFPEEQQRKYYDRYVVPETGRIFFQAAFAQLDPHHTLHVNFKNDERAPLLLITSEFDHLVPAHVSRSNYERYKDSAARTDFHEFPGRSHLLIAQDGWEEIADYVLGWLEDRKVMAGSAGTPAAA